MNSFPWDQTVVGWVHITSAAAVAGFFFAWLLAIQPSGGDAVRGIVARYRPFFWAAALLLPLTGAYTWHIRAGQGYPGFYFHVIYSKLLLYVVLFGIAGMLTSARRTSRGSGDSGGGRSGLLVVCVVLCLVILFLSAFMRRVTPVQTGTAATGISVMGTTSSKAVVTKKGVAPGWLI